MSDTPLRHFLEIPYEQLEELNLEAKQQRLERVPVDVIREERMKYLANEKRIKAVTVCFSDLEGRLHMLDYDKKFLLKAEDNLTFDGSSIRGFAVQAESDLRLLIDWAAFYWLPADIFGPGKVLVFGFVAERDGSRYPGDLRWLLRDYADELYAKNGTVVNAANEIEGFLFRGRDAERQYYETGKFDYVSTGGYYHSLPGDTLRRFIDTAAEAQRAMGFGNEKDHPEVAPSQFEMNYEYSEITIAADQIQLYKLLARQAAARLDCTASFLPKPVPGVNGSGMHTNISLARKGKNLFWSKTGQDQLSKLAWDFVARILESGDEICLVLNASVNAYRRFDPNYEAPNQIKVSPTDRGSMIRIPIANERSSRIEVRSIAPDANPYMALYTVLRTGMEGPKPQESKSKRSRTRFLPDNIHDAARVFKSGKFVQEILGSGVHSKYYELKQASADRCPKSLGEYVKRAEIMYHHEVTNQYLWSQF